MLRQRYGIKAGIMLLLAVMLLISACSGAGNETGNADIGGNAPGNANRTDSEEERSDGGSFTASIYDRGQVPADQGTYEDNRWTDWIDEQSGIDVTWVPIPRAQEADKFNVLVTSGQAPDLISSYDRNMLARFVGQGVAQPLDALVAEHSTAYKQYLEDHPELLPYLTFNGEMYGIASLRNTRAQTQIWVRQDWLDKLDLKMPTTVDELIEVAQAFRDGDPDGNGQQDTVAIAMSTAYGPIVDDWFMTRGGEWFVEDGKATLNFFTGRYEDSLAFRKLVYKEGLVDKEFVTDQNYARQKQLWTTGKSGFMFGTMVDGPYPEFFQNQPDAVMAAVPPLATKYGTNGYQKEVPNFILSIVNKNAKDPEAIIRYLDWMITDGWQPLTYGEEGIHHEIKDGHAVILDPDKFKNEVQYGIEYRTVHQERMTPESLAATAGSDPLQQKINALKGAMIQISEGTPYRKDFPYPPTVAEFSDIAGTLTKKFQEITTQVTMGGPDATPEWGIAQIRKEYDNLGGDNITAKVQEWYDANKHTFQP